MMHFDARELRLQQFSTSTMTPQKTRKH